MLEIILRCLPSVIKYWILSFEVLNNLPLYPFMCRQPTRCWPCCADLIDVHFNVEKSKRPGSC